MEQDQITNPRYFLLTRPSVNEEGEHKETRKALLYGINGDKESEQEKRNPCTEWAFLVHLFLHARSFLGDFFFLFAVFKQDKEKMEKSDNLA